MFVTVSVVSDAPEVTDGVVPEFTSTIVDPAVEPPVTDRLVFVAPDVTVRVLAEPPLTVAPVALAVVVAVTVPVMFVPNVNDDPESRFVIADPVGATKTLAE